jgi:alkylation response protein AidB-like acyl-CoA dehydrogenase
MDLSDSPAEARLRHDLRAWLGQHLTAEWRAGYDAADAGGQIVLLRQWQRDMHAAGFAARAWPTEYGGQDGSLNEQLIIFEELAKADGPPDVFRIGVRIIAPMLMALGREDQKSFFLPGIADGRFLWSQGFSEPGAGSDLAGLSTRAVKRDGGYLVNGQKVWNTLGQHADYCLLLARTDPDAKPHKGLTAFVVKLDSPGIRINPLRQINGRRDFNEIFFEDVELDDGAVVGEVNGGWSVAITMLGFERRGVAVLGFACAQHFARLLELAKTTRLRQGGGRVIEDPAWRAKLAALGVQARIAVLNNYRFAAMVPKGGTPGPEAPMQKLHSTELNKQMHDFAFEIMKAADLGAAENRDLFAYWGEEYLTSIGLTIAGGTAQIQRTIIGERALGLPR